VIQKRIGEGDTIWRRGAYMSVCMYASMLRCRVCVYLCMNTCMRCRACGYVCMHVAYGNLVRHYAARQFLCPGEPDFMSDQGFRLDCVLDMLTYHFLY
jgi:hypothetical protein